MWDSPASWLATKNWHRALAEAVREPGELLTLLDLPELLLPQAQQASQLFPLMVPRSFVARMQPRNVDDPLLRQVLPIGLEASAPAGFKTDAVGDLAARTAPGLLEKYTGRVLLIATGTCAVNCRYCFRRHYPYSDEPRRLVDWEPALKAIRDDLSIQEVILSGGDPLMLTDQRVSELCQRVREITHIRRLRLHTRLPIVLPERVTDDLLTILTEGPQATIVVVHANHPNEIVGECATALSRLVRGGLTVLNQSVLLRGVNDNLESLVGLSEALINLGVMPYYLHQLDRVAGTAHFEVSDAKARELVAGMRRVLPGYGVPQLVREVAGAASKTPL